MNAKRCLAVMAALVMIPSAWAQAPAFHDAQATGVAPVSAASPGAAPAQPPPMPVDPQAGHHLAPGQAAPSPLAASPAAGAHEIPGTSEVPGVPDQPVRPVTPGADPVSRAETLPIARGQDQTPDVPSGDAASQTPSGNRLAFNVYLIAGLMILGLVVLMLIFPPRRTHGIQQH